MTMKAINIAELKSHLSKYLRAVRRGERILVLDRKDPVAELVPPSPARSAWEQLAQLGRLSMGTQDWEKLELSRVRRRVPIQDILQKLREE